MIRTMSVFFFFFFKDLHFLTLKRCTLRKIINMGNLFQKGTTQRSAYLNVNAAVKGHLELTLLKGRQRFDAISTSNLEVY